MPKTIPAYQKCKRIEEIDILKSIGIICMVAGHSNAPFTKFIYLFHMAVFFIASGYFFKSESSDSFKSVCQELKKRLYRLWLPFFLWNTIYVLFHNLFIVINVYTDNPQLLDYMSGRYATLQASYGVKEILIRILCGVFFTTSERMFSAAWFIKVLVIITICYLLFDYLIQKISKKKTMLFQSVISLVLLLLGFLCSINNLNLNGFEQAASFYVLYHMGTVLSFFKGKYNSWNWKPYVPLFFISFGTLLLLKMVGAIELSKNSYMNPGFLIITSITGWVYLYSISYFIKQFTLLKRIMTEIGKRTLTVMILHLLAFKIVEYFIILFYRMPPYCLAIFPSLYGNKGMWWLAYTIIGVGVPVLFDYIFRGFKKALQKHNGLID